MDRDSMICDLVQAARTGSEVKRHALDLGFKGRALKDMTLLEVERLYLAVWPKVEMKWTPDDSPDGLAFNASLPF